MSDDPLAVLERQLVGAARRQAAARRPRRRRIISPVLAGAAVLIPVLAVVAALTLSSTRSRPGAGASSAGGLTLRDELAVLRRPQRPSDLTSTIRSTAQATVERPLMRRVLVRPAGGSAVEAIELFVSVANRPGAPQRLGTYVTHRIGTGAEQLIFTQPVTAGEFSAQGITTSLGGRAAGIIVPDRVTKVVLSAPGTRAVAVRPQANVAAFLVPGSSADVYVVHMTMRWYDARGRLLRRVGPSQLQLAPTAGPAPTRVVRTPPSPVSAPLRAILGVLRRPQTPADLALPLAHTSSFSTPTTDAMVGTPEYGLMRRAGGVFLLPYRPPAPWQIAGLPSRLRAQARHQAIRTEELFYFLGSGNGGQIGSAADVAAGRALAEYGGGVQAGQVLPLRLILVVPDGVTAVGFTVSQQAGGDRTYRVAVRGNVATLRDRTGISPLQIVWYGPRGSVLKRYAPHPGG